jgi:hypothetical protein
MDHRTRLDRVQIRTAACQQQLPRLVDRYLVWKVEGAPTLQMRESSDETRWNIVTVDMFGIRRRVVLYFRAHMDSSYHPSTRIPTSNAIPDYKWAVRTIWMYWSGPKCSCRCHFFSGP